MTALLRVCVQAQNEPNKPCSHPHATYSPSPTYFYDKGIAIVSILVDEKGSVHEPRLVQSSGSRGYDKDAMSTIRRWRFDPALCDGKPSPTRIAIELKTTAAR